MTAAELLKNGQLTACYEALTADVRQNPADARLRVFLTQLHCILGNWDKALTQLKVATDLDPGNLLLAQCYGPAIHCERFRDEVFAGKRTPLVFDAPPVWIGKLVQANQLAAQDAYEGAEKLRNQAYEEAPAIPGTLDGQPFAWLADGDSRLGPVLEAIIDRKYYWVPLTAVTRIRIEAPKDLHDLVWIPATLTWTNEGQAGALIPVRYPGSTTVDDDAIKMARRTDWQEKPNGLFLGQGQRMWTTDSSESPLLGTRLIELDHAGLPAKDT
jgi:type VI secretion system protein ImpE